MATVLLDTDDLGEAEQVLSRLYTKVRISGDTRAATHSRIARTYLGQLIFDDNRADFELSFNAEPPQLIHVCRMHAGLLELWRPGRPAMTAGAGEVVASGALEAPFSGVAHRVRSEEHTSELQSPKDLV